MIREREIYRGGLKDADDGEVFGVEGEDKAALTVVVTLCLFESHGRGESILSIPRLIQKFFEVFISVGVNERAFFV